MSLQPATKVPLKGWITTFAGTTINLCLGILYAWSIWKKALVNVVDPRAVAQAIAAGVGAMVTVEVGGSLSPGYFQPVTFTGYVKTISDGTFTFKGPGMRGVPHHMGRTVVLVRDDIHLVAMERGVSQWDPELYRCLGQEPTDARIVQHQSLILDLEFVESHFFSRPARKAFP